MKRLLILLLLAGCTQPAPLSPSRPSMRELVELLAGDRCEGRMTGEPGEALAADLIEGAWPRGLEPFLPDGARQPFEFKHANTAIKGTNVIGCVKGTDRPYDIVIIGAHYDHLGKDQKGIHHGADDNASGTAVLIELAHRFAAKPCSRTIVIAHFSGEELGILGSKAFAGRVPGTYSMVAMLNMDMVGRMKENKLVVLGADTSPSWESILKDANTGGLALGLGKGGTGPSDHTSFYLKNVPVLHFFTGAHADYHKPSDTAEKLNYDGMAQVADLVEAVARRVADSRERLAFQKSTADVAPKEGTPPPSNARPSLGLMFDYSDMSVIRIDGVTSEGPGEKAGVKVGDQIVKLNGRELNGLQEYSDRFFALKPGDVIELTLLRDGKTVTVKATVGAKQ